MKKFEKLKCECVENDSIPYHLCPNITVTISFKYKPTNIMNFWIQEPFQSLFENDPQSAGEFIEKIMKFAKKKLQQKIKETNIKNF